MAWEAKPDHSQSLGLDSVREERVMRSELLSEAFGVVCSHGGNDALPCGQRRPPRRDAGKILEDRLRGLRRDKVEVAEERGEHGIDHAEGGAVEIGARCKLRLQSLEPV